ncbi:MAG: MMPL family transporter [Verrucomicrobiae bacterium]|nr:MMPL family transporter [Verrucomicrobiae bacterium]
MRAILLLLVWGGLTAMGLSRLSFNVDVLDLLPRGRPEFDGIRDLYRHFGRKNELLVTLSAPEAEAAKSAAASLGKHLSEGAGLTRRVVWELPFESQPELGGELLAWLWLNSPTASVTALRDRLAPETLPETLTAVLDDLSSGFLGEDTLLRSYDPLGFTELPGGLKRSLGADADLFSSSDGTYRVIYVEAPVAEFSSYQDTAAWIDQIRAAIAIWQHDQPDSVVVQITGEPAFVAEISLAMERDMTGSVIATTILIAALFWLWHRRWIPLLWLILMLALIFSITFAIGGLWFGKLTAMSLGFAAILLGLAVDYGIVLYRESGVAAGDPRRLRRLIGPGIFWAAATTAAVFASLNLSSLPGIADLGTLVAVGTLVGAGVMLGLFAPIAARHALPPPPQSATDSPRSAKTALIFTGLGLLFGIGTWLILGPPGLDRDAKPFQLRYCPTTAALEEMAERLGGDAKRDLPHLPVIVTAATPEALADRLGEAEERLRKAKTDGVIRDFQLPLALAPDPRNQQVNRPILAAIATDRDRLIHAILDAGFSDEATALTIRVLDSWTAFSQEKATPLLPHNDLARWLLDRAVSGGQASDFAAVGRLLPASLDTDEAGHLRWASAINAPGIQITGWETLNPVLQTLVARDFRRVFLPMAGILAVMLLVVFRNVREALLSIAALAFSGLSLMALTRWLPVEWNAFNASSLPILFGTGLDYSIHVIFALRREKGHVRAMQAGIGKALLFCGLSTAAGFGSLAFASSEGLSSLGMVCALGITINMATAVWLLPWWWRAVDPTGLGRRPDRV